MSDRTWIGEAQAAFDQAITEATAAYDRARERPNEDVEEPTFDFWVARAQAAAAIASAEQARIGNLIAWKQMQIAREKQGIDALPTGTDAIDESIERALGISS